MKIGILTFHRAHNYGAVLQAYALVTYLRNQGYDADIVDYRPAAIEKAHGTLPLGRLKGMSFLRKIIFLLKLLPYLPFRYIRSKIFKRFINSLPTSEQIYDDDDDSISGYDYLIVGSDQVWNTKITNGFSKFYGGKVKTDAKWISYAASAEIKPNQADISIFKEILNNFSRISVRECLFQKQLQKISSKNIYQVLDPVFLLSKNEWLTLAKRPFKNKSYILVYQVKRDSNVLRYAEEWASFKNLEVIEITAEADFIPRKNRFTGLSPQEFVGAFADAKGIVTTSFHGTAFAALFEKPFKLMIFNAPGDYRALDLIQTIGLSDCVITPSSKPDNDKVNYDRSIFLSMISKSKDFLKFNE